MTGPVTGSRPAFTSSPAGTRPRPSADRGLRPCSGWVSDWHCSALAGVGLILAASGFGRLFSLALIAILLADLSVCWLMVELRRRR